MKGKSSWQNQEQCCSLSGYASISRRSLPSRKRRLLSTSTTSQDERKMLKNNLLLLFVMVALSQISATSNAEIIKFDPDGSDPPTNGGDAGGNGTFDNVGSFVWTNSSAVSVAGGNRWRRRGN